MSSKCCNICNVSKGEIQQFLPLSSFSKVYVLQILCEQIKFPKDTGYSVYNGRNKPGWNNNSKNTHKKHFFKFHPGFGTRQ